MNLKAITPILVAALFVACSPQDQSATEREKTKAETALPPKVSTAAKTQPSPPEVPRTIALPDAPQAQELPPHKVAPTHTNNEHSFSLLCGPWRKYLRGAPEIYSVAALPSGIDELLKQEQELIKSVIEIDIHPNQTSDYSTLEERLDQLKAMIPNAETSSGYVRRSVKSKHSYAYGSTVYINSYPSSYSYTVFREKEKSSSPELVRSVQSIATNATLEDLDQRIDALQYEISKWNRRISQMSTNGTEGIMRDANEAYIAGLQKFTKDFIQLRTEVKKIEQAQALKQQQKSQILQQWKNFEDHSLPTIASYLSNNQTQIIEISSELNCTLRENELKNKLILACEIGPRTLYFELNGRHPSHPFVLADVTPQK